MCEIRRKSSPKVALDGQRIGLTFVRKLKDEFDSMLLAGDWENQLRYWTRSLDYPTKFAAASCFSPNVDFDGAAVNIYRSSTGPLYVMISVFPAATGGVVLTCVRKKDFRKLRSLLKTLEQAGHPQFNALLSELILRNCENVAFSPLFWNAIGEQRQQSITDFYNATIHAPPGAQPLAPGLAIDLFSDKPLHAG